MIRKQNYRKNYNIHNYVIIKLKLSQCLRTTIIIFGSTQRWVVTSMNQLYTWEMKEHKLEVKSTVFWDIKPCGPLKVNRCFGGTYRLHFQGRRMNRARNQRETRWQAEFSRSFLARLILRPWRWRRYIPPKRLLTFNGLHGVISQKTVLYVATAVRT
jgi:hypothetical protein